MGSIGDFINDFTDDVLGLDPNGGGIYDVPVVGDILDDQLGLDPGQSGLQHLLEIAGWATLGTAAAGAAGVGPLAGPIEALQSGAPLSEVFPSWGSLTGAEQASLAGEVAAAAPAGSAVATSAAQAASNPGIWSSLASAAGTAGSILGGVGSAIGGIAQGAAALAPAIGAGAEIYDAITGGGAEADRELVRGSVADAAPLTDLQREGIGSAAAAARDPRLATVCRHTLWRSADRSDSSRHWCAGSH